VLNSRLWLLRDSGYGNFYHELTSFEKSGFALEPDHWVRRNFCNQLWKIIVFFRELISTTCYLFPLIVLALAGLSRKEADFDVLVL
jgi:hypothetical protein